MKKFPLLIGVCLCLFLSNCKEDDCCPMPKEEGTEKITAFTDSLTTLYDSSELPGFAVTIVKDGAISYQHAFGQADVANNKPYTNQTTQPIGSVSKTFIGLALMKAIEAGHFTLETPIQEILPFSILNPHTPDEPILVKHLVTHTSGFEDTEENYELQYYIKEGENALLPTSQVIQEYGIEFSDGMPLGDYLKAVYAEGGELYDSDNFLSVGPGKEYEYSNISASLAAYLIEVKTGQPYADFVKATIFNPLGMNSTAFDRSALATNNLATLYIAKPYPLPEYSHPSYPDGFISTSNEDLSLFLLEMMKGAAGTGTLLSKASYETLFKRQSPEGLEDGEIHAVFWDLPDNGRIEHNGADPGVLAMLSFDPLRNKGYIVLTNIFDGGLGGALGVDGDIAFGQFFEVLNAVRTFEKAN